MIYEYEFDMSKMSIGDYVDLLTSNDCLKVAFKCSKIDLHDIPLTDLSRFIEDFGAALAKHVEIQFPPKSGA